MLIKRLNDGSFLIFCETDRHNTTLTQQLRRGLMLYYVSDSYNDYISDSNWEKFL